MDRLLNCMEQRKFEQATEMKTKPQQSLAAQPFPLCIARRRERMLRRAAFAVNKIMKRE